MPISAKSALRRKIYETARFIYRLPIYWRLGQSDIAMNRVGLGSAGIAINSDSYIRLPDHALASSIFRRMAWERANVHELKEFIALAEGRSRFVDVGASGGFFSAVFAALKAEKACEILSIEIDPPSLDVLKQMRERNSGAKHRWEMDTRAVSNQSGSIQIASTGYGAQLEDPENADELRADRQKIGREHDLYSVEMETLGVICNQNNIVPDFVKVDIEGFEMEMLEGALEFFPRTSRESHWNFMLRRSGIVVNRLNSF